VELCTLIKSDVVEFCVATFFIYLLLKGMDIHGIPLKEIKVYPGDIILGHYIKHLNHGVIKVLEVHKAGHGRVRFRCITRDGIIKHFSKYWNDQVTIVI